MKTFTEYLAESKKTYSLKVKIAGDLPEDFANLLKSRIENRGIITFEQMKTTPVTELPHDFPELKNMEVHTFDVMTEYPITPTEIEKEIFEMGCCQPGYYKLEIAQVLLKLIKLQRVIMLTTKVHYYMTTNTKMA